MLPLDSKIPPPVFTAKQFEGSGPPEGETVMMSRSATVDSLELRALLNSGRAPRLIDVRTPAEFETAHIPGAYNVPLDLLREHRDEIVKHLDQNVVLVCRSGQRAAQADETLRRAGLVNVYVLDGGITAWTGKGFDVNRGAQRWDVERQVRLFAGLIVALSILVSVSVPGVQWVAFAIGAGLTVAALTNSCAMGMLLSRLPYNRGVSCDAQTIVAQLVDPAKAR
jgi:rhodanese-related sulfurtransferase